MTASAPDKESAFLKVADYVSAAMGRPTVRDGPAVLGLIEQVRSALGEVEVLVHNALIPYAVKSFDEISWDELGGKLEQEMRAAFLVTKAVVPGMIARGYGRRGTAVCTIDLTHVGLGIHEELVAYVADQQNYYEQESVHVALRDGTAWDIERVRRTATIGLGRAVLSRLTDGTRRDAATARLARGDRAVRAAGVGDHPLLGTKWARTCDRRTSLAAMSSCPPSRR